MQQNELLRWPDLFQRSRDGARRIVGCGEDLERAKLAGFNPHAISTGPAGIHREMKLAALLSLGLQVGSNAFSRFHGRDCKLISAANQFGLLAINSNAPMRLNSRSSAAFLNHLPEYSSGV